MTNSTLTTPDTKIAAVERLYAAYGSGDIAGVLAELADDVDWAAEAASTSVPWYGTHAGKAAVPGFFGAIAESIDISAFDIVAMTSGESDVVAVVRWSFTVKATGKTAVMTMLHWFHFAGGRISMFRGTEDSEQTAAAFRP